MILFLPLLALVLVGTILLALAEVLWSLLRILWCVLCVPWLLVRWLASLAERR